MRISFNKTPNITEDKIVDKWDNLVIGLGGKGEQLLREIARGLQELKMPDVTLSRKEVTMGKPELFGSNKKREYISVKHNRYRDYEIFIGAVDRAGQLSVAWYLTVELPGAVRGKIRGLRHESKKGVPSVMKAPQNLSKKLSGMLAAKINEKLTGSPGAGRNVHPEDMTMDDREELGAYVDLIHKTVLDKLEVIMSELNLDFSKVDKHTEGFFNLS